MTFRTREIPVIAFVIFCLASSAFASVTVTSPANGSTSGSPVQYSATSWTSCGSGVASMGIYVENVLKFVSNGSTLNTSMSFGPGTYNTVVEEWDNCGGATYTPVKITVGNSNQSGVYVTSPANNSTVGNSVNYVATATSTCSKGVASMGVYVDNSLQYVSNGGSLNTTMNIGSGGHNTVVEEWDYCGGASYTPVAITVNGSGGGGGGGGQGTTMSQLQSKGGWVPAGELPSQNWMPIYYTTSHAWWTIWTHASPSESGNATQYSVGGDTPYADILFTNALIGPKSTQGIYDSDHKLIPTLHNFEYDVDFYTADVNLPQVLEFDVSEYTGTNSLIFGTQCNIGGGHVWDYWNNKQNRWLSTGIACNPVNGWNHLKLNFQKESDSTLLYQTINLNGWAATLNKYDPPNVCGAPGYPDCRSWWGITVNFQMDMNKYPSSYKVNLDNFNFRYW